mgnify:CR=1 FL=1
MLCEKYGIDNSDINVASAKTMWNGKENKDVRTMLTMANDSVYSVSKDIYVENEQGKGQGAENTGTDKIGGNYP